MSRDRVKLWAVLCFAATVTSAMWLGVIEVGNARLGGLLQKLPQATAESQPAAEAVPAAVQLPGAVPGALPGGERWAHRYFKRDEVAAALAIDAAGRPLPQPYSDVMNEQIDRTFAQEAGRNHLYRLLLGFGPTLYVLLAITVASGVMLAMTAPVPWLRAAGGVCLVIAAVLLWRAVALGVLTHGMFTAMGWV